MLFLFKLQHSGPLISVLSNFCFRISISLPKIYYRYLFTAGLYYTYYLDTTKIKVQTVDVKNNCLRLYQTAFYVYSNLLQNCFSIYCNRCTIRLKFYLEFVFFLSVVFSATNTFSLRTRWHYLTSLTRKPKCAF